MGKKIQIQEKLRRQDGCLIKNQNITNNLETELSYNMWLSGAINLDDALKINPEFALAWHNRGITFAELEEYEEAVECYDEAIQLDPELDDTWHKKGMALYYLSKFKEAITCYNEAIMLNSDSPDSWHNKGMTFEQLGKHAEAATCYDQAIRLKYHLKSWMETIKWNFFMEEKQNGLMKVLYV